MGQYHEDENAWDYLRVTEDKRQVRLGNVVHFFLSESNLTVVVEEQCDHVYEADLNKVEMQAFIVALMHLYQQMEDS